MNDEQIAEWYLLKAKRAREAGHEFSLSLQSFCNLMRAKKCFYTGIALVDHGKKDSQSKGRVRTIDRIDNSKGYVKGNVVACCSAFNRLKATIENGNNCLDVKSVLRGLRKL